MNWNHWVVSHANLRDTPGGRKLCEMPFGSLVYATGQTSDIVYSAMITTWANIIYQTGAAEFNGWVYAPLIEPYDLHDHQPVVSIPHQTVNPQDAAQYMHWIGNVQFNLCGELCVCYLMGVSLDDLLLAWEPHSPSVFKRIFYGGKSHGTGIADLDDMLTIFDMPTPSLRLADGLADPVLGRALVTPARMEFLLQRYQAIVGVRIETHLGRLKPGGAYHWVVVNSVYPHGINSGAVEVYNPFTNLMEGYSWAEFTASMGSPQGLWVARR